MSFFDCSLDAVGVLWQLVAEDDEGGGAHPEADELHLFLPSLLPHQILRDESMRDYADKRVIPFISERQFS